MKILTNKSAKDNNSSINKYKSDRELWNGLLQGYKDAFQLIYQQNFWQLYAYGKKLTTDTDLIKDVIQDLFIHIWHKRSSLSETDSIKYYLFKSLKRRLLYVQGKEKYLVCLQDIKFLLRLEPEMSVEHNIIQMQRVTEQVKHLAAGFTGLTKRENQAIKYKYYTDLPYSEIALKMNISTPAVYNIISNALTKLRKVL